MKLSNLRASRFPYRFDKVAEGFGARGVRLEDPSLLPEAIEEGFASARVTVIHVPIESVGPADRLA